MEYGRPSGRGEPAHVQSTGHSSARKAIGDGLLDANISNEHPPKDAVEAHRAIESETTLGASVLVP